MRNKPLRIGITGGIGTGKTLVASIFSILGIPIYDADTRAKWIANQDEDVKSKIITLFGKESYLDNGLNRRYLAETVFRDKEKTEKLNAIIHPRVGEDFIYWTKQHQNAPYLIKEAALMYESNAHKNLDKVIVVTAPLALRIERIRKRDPQRTENEIIAIMDKQMPEDVKRAKADYILSNDEQQLLLPQVVALDKTLRLV